MRLLEDAMKRGVPAVGRSMINLIKPIGHIVAASALLLYASGCACTQFVQNMGKTDAFLQRHDAYMDALGNVYVEAELKRFPLNRKSAKSSLGTRYLILNAPGFQNAVEQRVAESRTYKRRGQVRLEIHASNYQYPTNEVEAQKTAGWYVYPPNIVAVRHPDQLPEYLRANEWTQFTHDPIHEFSIPATVGDQSYLVDVEVSSHALNSPDDVHQAAWAYPFKILIVPAFVVDVVTLPIQYIWFMFQISKIKG